MKIDPRIITAVSMPEGVSPEKLAEIAPDYRDQIEHLVGVGFPIICRVGAVKQLIYRLDIETSREESPTVRVQDIETGTIVDLPLAPPDIKPPADAPHSPEPEVEQEPSQAISPSRDLEATFAASDFKLQSRDGSTPKIYLIPANEDSAAAALQFSMRRPRGSMIEVTLRVRWTARKATAKAAATVAGEAATAIADRAMTEGTKGDDMPIYEYACKACGHEFEELQTVTEGGTAKCPICGAAAERRISVPQRAIIRENATKPAEKGKAQIEKELGEQVNSGELPAELAAQQAKMANL